MCQHLVYLPYLLGLSFGKPVQVDNNSFISSRYASILVANCNATVEDVVAVSRTIEFTYQLFCD